MKNLIVFLTVFLFSFVSFAQQLKVIDETGNGIENVIAVGDDFTSHTNSKGILKYFPPDGVSRVTFIHPNYKRRNLPWDSLAANNFVVVLRERIRQLEEVTIRPSKRSQNIDQASQRVLPISIEDIQLAQPQTTAEMLELSGEVFMQKSQMGGGSPMLRGFSANRILLVVDGVRMNNAIYRSGNVHNAITLDVSSLEQTEVIMGPGSVVYGSDALGGVIHFTTIKPRLSTSEVKAPLQTMMRTSSANFEKTAHVNFNLAGKKWAAVTSITLSDYDDLLMGGWLHNEYLRPEYVQQSTNELGLIVQNPNPNKQIYSGYTQLNMVEKVRYRPSEKFDMEYAFHFSTTTDMPRYDRLIQYSGDHLKYQDWHYGPQKWMMQTIKALVTDKNEMFDFASVQLAYQDYTESREEQKFNKPEIELRIENLDAWSMNIDFDKNISPFQTLYYGFEGIYNRVHSTGLETFSNTKISSRYPDGSNWWSLAVYAMYNQELSERTNLQAGARYNFTGVSGVFDKTFFNFPYDDFKDADGALTVNFGLVFKSENKVHVNLNASTGFRSPNIDDVAKVFDSEPGVVIVPNRNLDPEYASSFEAGIKYNPSQQFTVNFTTYFTRLYNAMVRRDGTFGGQDFILYSGEMSKVKMLTNASWANIGGLAFKARYKISDKLETSGILNYQSGRDSDEIPLRHISPLFGNLHLTFDQVLYKIDLYTVFNGEISYSNLAPDERDKSYMYASDENGNPYAPAWATLNLKGFYNVNEKIQINAGIENLLNMRYRSYSSGIVAPGINFILAFNLKI